MFRERAEAKVATVGSYRCPVRFVTSWQLEGLCTSRPQLTNQPITVVGLAHLAVPYRPLVVRNKGLAAWKTLNHEYFLEFLPPLGGGRNCVPFDMAALIV